jgi:hypothetical protein
MIILTRSALNVVFVAKHFPVIGECIVVIHWCKRNNWVMYS